MRGVAWRCGELLVIWWRIFNVILRYLEFVGSRGLIKGFYLDVGEIGSRKSFRVIIG